MSSRTMFVMQEGPANALALNKDHSQVVIAGRNVFKVFSIEEEEFVECYNLRVGKNLNLNFSCNDVAWNTNEDHLLATAATNGAVVLWNLNRPSRSKQDHVFSDHKRTVNKVSFHSTESTWLISGSQDGTMKCFDLRIKEATRTFYSNTESVRDVQFSPRHHHTFAAVSENGNVQLWDLRRPDRFNHQFTAHSGPIFACDWHPDVNWLATASRDKTIKVWDLIGKPVLEYTIHTIASVGRIKWRPQRKYHIASCALVVDCSINVWDVRRPYIPFAAFNEHKDVATGIAWRGDPHVFLSTSRDCTLYHHVFRDASRPANKANPQGISLNSKGDVSYALRQNPSAVLPSKFAGLVKKLPTHNEQFCLASSTLQQFSSKAHLDVKSFLEAAKRYLLTGKSLSDICDHNALVAKDLGKHQIHLVWCITKTLYTSKVGDYQQSSGNASKEEGNTATDGVTEGDQWSVRHQSAAIERGETPGGFSEDNETETDETDQQDRALASLASGLAHVHGDFFFGDGEMDQINVEFDQLNGLDQSQDWILPSEAFQPRHEIQDRSPPPEQFPNHCSPDMADTESQSITVEDPASALLCVPSLPRINAWDSSPVVAAALHQHAKTGDVQTSVSVLLALGERRRGLVDELTQEQWLLAYLDLLARHKMWEVATQWPLPPSSLDLAVSLKLIERRRKNSFVDKVIQLAWIPSVSQLNQQSTTVHTNCGRCSKPLLRAGWWCDRCHSASNTCSVCHQVVRGMYVWCQGCSHGGHLPHIQEWMASNRYCATGCGHMCEYT